METDSVQLKGISNFIELHIFIFKQSNQWMKKTILMLELENIDNLLLLTVCCLLKALQSLSNNNRKLLIVLKLSIIFCSMIIIKHRVSLIDLPYLRRKKRLTIRSQLEICQQIHKVDGIHISMHHRPYSFNIFIPWEILSFRCLYYVVT